MSVEAARQNMAKSPQRTA